MFGNRNSLSVPDESAQTLAVAKRCYADKSETKFSLRGFKISINIKFIDLGIGEYWKSPNTAMTKDIKLLQFALKPLSFAHSQSCKIIILR